MPQVPLLFHFDELVQSISGGKGIDEVVDGFGICDVVVTVDEYGVEVVGTQELEARFDAAAGLRSGMIRVSFSRRMAAHLDLQVNLLAAAAGKGFAPALLVLSRARVGGVLTRVGVEVGETELESPMDAGNRLLFRHLVPPGAAQAEGSRGHACAPHLPCFELCHVTGHLRKTGL